MSSCRGSGAVSYTHQMCIRDRFCNLLAEMRAKAPTRFIAITHNPLTMSRMDRLYGVTMRERGVSQLVSVDLRQAEAMVAQ